MGKTVEGLNVLVVDDYPSIRARLVETLKEMGCEITEAGNGVEAIESLRTKPFDLLFTDIVMPEMDGFELCEEVRKNPDLLNLPIVVVSTHYDSNYIIKALRLGADDYVPKPIEPDLVRKVVARVLTPTRQEGNHG